METLGAVAIVVLALACPVGMAAMGVVAWLIARARGQKQQLSMACMPDHGEQATGSQEDSALKEQVTRLEREVESLRTQTNAGRSEQ